ncbi:uncharacterized protein TNIN_399061 [Trichonephila inaurata madagascariensis]|uniref:Mutator-like transposase domain-containing protein n=1 Tax=Trichonephila inaurata madagascariensis TaxID=2747483 RepID=A0A8X6XBJ5_9ARAC|nr:uncharacterized protein TNIN_399061 [Trichonephila inaurata madagascariensis]
MKILSEVRKGLNSGIRMKREMRHFQEIELTEDLDYGKMPVNIAAVSDIPPLSSKTYQKEHNIIPTAWEKVSEKEMYRAAMEEKELAIQAGEIRPDAFPMLTVVVDGCWAKQSYRINYSSLSGAAVIVGFRTKKSYIHGCQKQRLYGLIYSSSCEQID